MNVHRVVLSIIDFDDIGIEAIEDIIENARYPNRCIDPKVHSTQTIVIEDWTDQHPLNNQNTADTEFDRLFA